MLPILADISDASPQGIKDTLLVIGFLVGLAAGIFGMLRKQAVPAAAPQPFEVKEAPQYASVAGVKSLDERMQRLESGLMKLTEKVSTDIGSAEDALSKEGEARAVRINERIDALVLAIGELRGGEKAHSQTLDSLIAQISHARGGRKPACG